MNYETYETYVEENPTITIELAAKIIGRHDHENEIKGSELYGVTHYVLEDGSRDSQTELVATADDENRVSTKSVFDWLGY